MKTFKFKVYSGKKTKALHAQINLASQIWNHLIALHKRYYRLTGKQLPVNRLKVHITTLKKRPRFQHWNNLGSQAIQDIAERIDRSYQRFFDNVKDRKAGKTTQRVSPPGFKKRRNYTSFTLKQAGWAVVSDGCIRIGKTLYRFWQSRDIVGTIKTVTVKRDRLGDLYVCFSCKLDMPAVRREPCHAVGLDFGLKTFLVGSDGLEQESPQFFKQGSKTVARATRALSRKKKGSNHRVQARKNVQRAHRKIARQRRHFHFELARQLCQQYSHIFLEDLNIKAMQRLWGRKISDLGFAEFVSILEHVAKSFGTVVHKIDRWFPSSKRCSACGAINQELNLKDRDWTCGCGVHHDRDRNASINLLREGASSLGLGDLRPACPAVAA